MVLGPIMLDLKGLELLPEERDMLLHPLVGGVILFSRNYATPDQVCALTDVIHRLREPRLLIAVDHEGGRVQRFRSGFSQLPPCAILAKICASDRHQALQQAATCGWLMAAELRAVGVDFSFAPVLDRDTGSSQVIGDRAFHADPEIIARLAHAYMRGMQEAGMAAVGKHFPGHGSVEADSHHELPIDDRAYEDIRLSDMVPFERMIRWGLPAIMPAHVVYPQVDAWPASFSPIWLKQILRDELEFQGALFSDDISMVGAHLAGDYVARARKALAAGCDMVLICNDPVGVAQVLEQLGEYHELTSQVRLMRMHGRHRYSFEELTQDERWQRASREIQTLAQEAGIGSGI